jgi:hypothetical protein
LDKATDLPQPETEADAVKRLEEYHKQLITIVGFLGGFLFAGLVLVLGNQDFILNSSVFREGFLGTATPEEFLQVVVAYLASVSAFSMIVVSISLRALTLEFQSIEGRKMLYKWVDWCAGIMFAAFVGALYLLLGPVNPWLSVWAGAVSVGSLAILTYILRKARGLRP